MIHCPKCNSQFADDIRRCINCGYVLSEEDYAESSEETTDVPAEMQADESAKGAVDSEERLTSGVEFTVAFDTDKTVDLDSDYSGEVSSGGSTDQPKRASMANENEFETVDLPLRKSTGGQGLKETEEHVEAIESKDLVEHAFLSTEMDSNTSTARLDSLEDNVDTNSTAKLGMYPLSDQDATVSYSIPLLPHVPQSQSKESYQDDDSATIDLTTSSTAEQDFDIGTVPISSGIAFPHSKTQATIPFSADELAAGGADSSRSSSSGRIRRVWGEAGGVSANPSRTINAGGLLASESIFEKVSSRLLVVEDPQRVIDIAIQRAKDKKKDQKLVTDCLQAACTVDGGVADYQVNGYLGRGAMGIVLQARQNSIGRDVAIKMIQPSAEVTGRTQSSTRDLQKRFLYEAQITGKLDHPNIVPIYELGVSNKVLFYAMKKIVGKEWKESIARLSKEENLDILMKVADAMALSHQRHIIHRDLKPENVMLGPFGEVLVTDWGCAVDLSLKEVFSGAGSPPWMAPEMALHQLKEIGTHSDIYLIGAMLYQIVTGYPPHGGRTVMEVLLAASRNQIVPTNKTDPLLDIARKAMATEPAQRYSTVEEMQLAIRQYRTHSESIALTERSQSTLELAQESQDYERFSRAVFGFQDALELWPGNSAADDGLKNARLAYGQCAFDRKDYDLCLVTLNRRSTEEAALYDRAESAKRSAAQREARFKTMRRALAAVVLIGLASSSIAAGVASYQKLQADRQKQIAQKNEEEAKRQKGIAEENAAEAKKQAGIALTNEEEAKRQKSIAEENAEEAKKQAEIALRNEEEAKRQADIAQEKEEEAKEQADIAQRNEREATKQTQFALQEQRRVELASLQSNLALSLSQVEQLDIDRARSLLTEVASEERYSALRSQRLLPKLKNWAWHRVDLLSNSDLLQSPLGDTVSVMAFAQKVNRGVIALTRDGKNLLQMVSVVNNRLEVERDQVLSLDRIPVEAISISPDGKYVLYSLFGQSENVPRLFQWNIESNSNTPVAGSGNRAFQGFVISGEQDIGGLNQGLWIWNRNQFDGVPSSRLRNVQGRLLSIQMAEPEIVLLLSEMPNGQRYPHLFNLQNPKLHRYLRVQEALGQDSLSAVAYAQNRLVLGTESGRMYTMPFDISLCFKSDGEPAIDISVDSLVEIPKRHYSRIRSIRAHADGTLLTFAEEPQVELWKPIQAEYGWQHEIRLAGITQNVRQADFGPSSNFVLAIAEDSRPIAWDVNRQRQRQQARRMTPQGNVLGYEAPVVNVVTSSDGRRIVSILQNGTVDRWNLLSGLSEHQGEIPWTNIGHSPKAKFVDMAIDSQAGVLITSARLPIDNSRLFFSSLGNKIRQGIDWDWEFVKWDLGTLQMVDRWHSRSKEEQAISLGGHGRFVLYGSDSRTRIQDLEKQETFLRDDFGAFFGVQHPIKKNLMMLVKLNGALMIVDVDDLAGSWKRSGYRLSDEDFINIATNGNRPVIGQWSPGGDRFYLVWESGRVTELAWLNEKLVILQDSGSSNAQVDLITDFKSSTRETNSSIRIASRWNVDMKVRKSQDFNLVYVLVRFPGKDGLTRLTRLAFPLDGRSKVLVQHSDARLKTQQCTLSDDELPRVITDPINCLRNRLPDFEGKIAGVRSVGSQTFVATTSGIVYAVDSVAGSLKVLGAEEVIAGTGDQSANRIATLHKGGVIWRADWMNGKWSWKQLPMVPSDAVSLAMSPDGSQIAVTFASGINLISSETGEQLGVIASVPAIMQWDRSLESSETRLAVIENSSFVKVIEEGRSRQIGQLPAGSRAKGVHFFREAWNDSAQKKAKWIMVHLEGSGQDELAFFNEDPNLVDKNRTLALTSKATSVECSPTEGVFAVGSSGSVSIHLAAPTLGESGKELFSLPGHTGANVRLLHFTSDGKTLFTGDSKAKLFGWLSQDPVPDDPAIGLALQTNQLK